MAFVYWLAHPILTITDCFDTQGVCVCVPIQYMGSKDCPNYYLAFCVLTVQYGKWHLGLYKDWALPMARGYDEQYGYYLGGEDYFTHERDGGLDWHRNDTLETGDNGTYSAYSLGNATVDFIQRKQDKPWFLYLAWQSVHSPLQVPDTYLERFPNLTGNVLLRNAMVAAMDDQMGAIVATLKQTDQLDNTLIVFTADNGAPYALAYSMGDEKEMVQAMGFGSNLHKRPPSGHHGKGGGSNYPLSGWKHWVFEGGVRSSAFVYYSKLNHPGTVHNGLFHSVDWLPTIVNLVGGDTSRNLALDGMDIWPAIQAGTGSPHRELPIEIAACGKNTSQTIVDGPQAAILVGEMKLIVDCWWRDSKDPSTAQLYNLTADISELNDLSKSQPETVKQLLARLDYWEGQSVDPYQMNGIDPSCGEGAPQGNNPPHWDVWC
eukprot:TRINITY_DN10639_c0_g3_i5.p1 TRINITY_DN10639_c0_g3~~TRINITY_DN10639_c0_g3_i5.p1  ORF type:complete len:432 (+),score=78.88 TRINITY_DN10639_c0_g3_i5:186-1481(+)